jgi:group I intron endonuclease
MEIVYKRDDFKLIPEKPGIYKIINMLNGDFYIGKSYNLRVRCIDHCYKRNSKNVKNCILYKAIKKYNIKNFKFEVMQLVDIKTENIDKLEEYYILQYDPKYNIIKSGQNTSTGKSLNEEKIIQIINLWNKGLNTVEIAKITNNTKKVIRDLINKKTYNYILQKNDLYINPKYSPHCYDDELEYYILYGYKYIDVKNLYPTITKCYFNKIKKKYNILNNNKLYEINQNHIKKIQNIDSYEDIKIYCYKNKIPLSVYNKFKKCNIGGNTLSEEMIIKIFHMINNGNTNRKDISQILNVSYWEIIELLRNSRETKYTKIKNKLKLDNKYKNKNIHRINEKVEKQVIEVFKLYNEGKTISDISNIINIKYRKTHRILFDSNRYKKIKSINNLHITYVKI